jgi:probable HAF family extracellular repeat protein
VEANANCIAYAISGDGNVIVGLGWTMCEATAFRWEAATGMVDLGALPGGQGSSRANAVDHTGSVIVGWDAAATGNRRAAIWVDGVERLLGSLDPLDPIDGPGEAYSVTPDGTQVFGESAGFMFRWTEAGGLENLGQLPPGGPFDQNIPLDVSDDGSVAVGQSGGFLGNPVRAFYWRSDVGFVDLQRLLYARGATGLEDWTLTSASGVSADGNVVVGVGVDGNGISQMYRAYLTTPPCGDGGAAIATFRADAAGLNRAGFTAPPPVIGSAWVATVDNTGTGSTIAGVVGYLTPLDVVLSFGSSLLVNIADPAGELLGLSIQAGTGAVPFQGFVPNVEGLCGLGFSAQGFALGGGQGVKLLNAYDCVVGGF